jgi:hypothetical protein
MFVDWSGSMSYVLHNTLKQVFTLALFCNRVQIPFEVYSFRTTTSEENYKMAKNSKKQAIFVPNQVNIDTTTNFKVRNLLSSRMKVSEMNKALKVLWTVGHYSGDIQSDPMTSTPLNSTIMVADKIINNFRTKYKLQIVNTVILTDGASDPICFTSASGYGHGYVSKNDVAVLRDPITKKTYSCGTGYQMTNTLLRVLKDRTNCNLIGFYLAHSLNGLGYMFDSTILHSKKVRDSWKNNKFVGIKTAGYDEYYITQFVDGSKPSILNIDPTMKPRAITKEFARFSEKKTVNRMMLKSLMDRVSQDSVV